MVKARLDLRFVKCWQVSDRTVLGINKAASTF